MLVRAKQTIYFVLYILFYTIMGKFVTIYGNREHCKSVNSEIMEAVELVATYRNKGLHDIKDIKYDKMINFKGLIENVSKADAQTCAKRRQSTANVLQSLYENGTLLRLRPMTVMSATGLTYIGHVGPNSYKPFAPASYPPMYPSTIPPLNSTLAADVQETAILFIPKGAVGAIYISSKDSNVRSKIRFGGESDKVVSTENEQPGPSGDTNSAQQASRKVTLGTAETLWKAQGMIFDKLLDEGKVSATEEVRLTVEILVPSSQVGRIIGHGGSNVRELQRVTGSIIKLPTQGSTDGMKDTITLHIIGRFLATHSTQMVATGVNPVLHTLQCNSSSTKSPQQ